MNKSHNTTQPNPRLISALDYAGRGWRVLPLHTPGTAGGCSCGRTPCRSAGKHPRIGNWRHKASADESQIRQWWATWPDANVGLATGKASGLAVLDVDPRHNGDASLNILQARHGTLPPTPTVETGGGGRHYFLRHPGLIHVKTITLARGVELRAEGAQVVAAPSSHESGAVYQWVQGAHPDDLPLASLPVWCLPNGAPQQPIRSNGRLTDGERNTRLTSMAGALRARGLETNVVDAALQAINASACTPPLDATEVREIAESVGRYAPGSGGSAATGYGAPASNRFRLHTIDELLSLPALNWVIEGIVEQPNVGFVYGPSGEGKTFLAVDLALSVASGCSWHGRRVVQGPVGRELFRIVQKPEGAAGLSH